ncbi:MAG TPA: outer membrane beta-barrel protein [Verrucomicrobiae bacterium]|jgi:hypothetical protein
MKIEKWTIALAAAGLVSLSPAVVAQNAAPAPQVIPLQTALSATTISGYVDTSAIWNPGTGNANPAPYAFNTSSKHDGFNVDAADVKIARAEDETAWAAGYVVELSYGPDAMAIDSGAYPIRQAYVEMKMPIGNGLDWQIGRWDNLLGYEVSDAYANPNFTRSYGYSFEPTEHTGLLATYSFGSSLKVQGGVADTVNTLGVNDRSDPGAPVIESKKSFVSLVTLTAPDSWGSLKGSTLVAGFDYGAGNHGGGNGSGVVTGVGVPGSGGTGQDREEIYVGGTINTPVKDLSVGAAWDYIHGVDIGSPDGGTLSAEYINTIAGYITYKIDKLHLNGRVEYANGPGLTALEYAANGKVPYGYTITNPDDSTTLAPGTGGPFNKVLAVTGTVQYDLWDNVITRLEVRWDHAMDSSTPFGGSDANDGLPNKRNELMVAANVIYKF